MPKLDSAKQAKAEFTHMIRVVDKLDTAIDKLTDVSSDIKQILAVHETRLDQTETIMERHFTQMDAVHNRVSNLRDDMNKTSTELLEKMSEIQTDSLEKINDINKWRWQVMGGAMALAALISVFTQMIAH
jgi:capsule polysaccharide export protein KpsE/RkpR